MIHTFAQGVMKYNQMHAVAISLMRPLPEAVAQIRSSPESVRYRYSSMIENERQNSKKIKAGTASLMEINGRTFSGG